MTGTFLPRLTGEEMADLTARLSDSDRPVLVGYGPVEFSTSLALEPYPSIIWDVNGYYRDLGVWQHATRKQIKDRYQILHGENNVRLTLIVGVLLNKVDRYRYDTTPMGELFYDAEIEENIKRRMADASAGQPSGESNKPNFAPTVAEIIEQQRNEREIQLTQRVHREHWSFYQLRTSFIDSEILSRWRALLAKACYGTPRHLAIGFMEGDEECRVEVVGYRTVIFFNVNTAPSDVVALLATTMVT